MGKENEDGSKSGAVEKCVAEEGSGDENIQPNVNTNNLDLIVFYTLMLCLCYDYVLRSSIFPNTIAGLVERPFAGKRLQRRGL